jgi:phage repressor protein C with HTH and peptisase S24 domain
LDELKDAKRRPGEKRPTMRSLSLDMDRNETWLHQFLSKGSPVELDERARKFLAAALDLDERLLRHEDMIQPARSIERERKSLNETSALPVKGHGAAGPDGSFEWNGETVDEIPRPHALIGVKDAYAIYVAGDSMEDRYYSGETVYVHPWKPIHKGHFVVVQVRGDGGDHLGYIKRFLSRDHRRLRLEQLNPKKVIEIPAQKVISVHRIIMGGDG